MWHCCAIIHWRATTSDIKIHMWRISDCCNWGFVLGVITASEVIRRKSSIVQHPLKCGIWDLFITGTWLWHECSEFVGTKKIRRVSGFTDKFIIVLHFFMTPTTRSSWWQLAPFFTISYQPTTIVIEIHGTNDNPRASKFRRRKRDWWHLEHPLSWSCTTRSHWSTFHESTSWFMSRWITFDSSFDWQNALNFDCV